VVIRAYKTIYIITLKAKTFILLLNLFSKRLALFNKKRIKNIDKIKRIKNVCETITKKLRKKRKKNKKIILTPLKKTNNILIKKKKNNTKIFKKNVI